MAIKVEASRFALLKVEDEADEIQARSTKTNKGESQSKNAQKKSQNKKKAENSQLKHLASGHASGKRRAGGVDQNSHSNHANGRVGKQQWEEWQKLDKEYTKDSFEKDLQKALLLSKLESEHSKQKKKTAPPGLSANAVLGGGDGKDSKDSKDSKKKKKKEKQQNTMSLDQFNKKLEEKKTHSDELETIVPPKVPKPSTKVPSAEPEDAFFKTVDSDVSRILRKEKMQEEYKKQYAAESVITAKYVEEIKRKDKEIDFLRATLKKQEEEYKQVKKRNKQLCVILAQGEMKDKAEVLMQVDQLTDIREELTEQVSELTAELEKERSKVHSLKAELDKLKGGKHK